MVKIGMVVKLIDDVYYGTNKETDHVFVTNIYDGKFDGIGITQGGIFRGCELENWQETTECIFTKSGHRINVTKRENEKYIYDISVDDVGYKGNGIASSLIMYIPRVIKNEYGNMYE